MKPIATVAAALTFIAFAAQAQAGAGQGDFVGASGHTTSGSVTVTEDDGKITITLEESFYLDGAPDPYVALGSGSEPANGGLIEELRSATGKQSYAVPATDELREAGEVIIWCKRFSVPLGVAKIE